MTKKILVLCSCVATIWLAGLLTSCNTEENTVVDFSNQSTGTNKSLPDQISFNYHVKPILSDRCYACHGPDKTKIEAGLSLSNAAAALVALGDKLDHHAIVPGNPEASTLVERITSKDEATMMPPPESNLTLNDYERAVLKKWIEQGAEYEDHWSFQPISNPELPTVEQEAFVSNGIDKFILAKIEAAGKQPSESAQKELLIRRLSFDVRGLPPTPEEIDAFINDTDKDAYEKIVDQYLNSPAYAENMTAFWMDVARYADTHGYQDDLERVMWPWRDWVLHAFKNNMPYDQFVIWQLAGDLLPDASLEQVIATGFNRNHKITQEGGVIPEEYRVEYVSDRTMTFGKAFLGLSVECAKCHDHKYDPISQEDYYSLYSFFNNVPEKGLIGYSETPSPFITLTTENIEAKATFIQNLDTVEQIELMVMEEMKTPRQTFVLGRGAYDNPKQEVFPSTPVAVLSFDGYEKNRKGLAEWLFNKDNPMTSRVMVNRLWMMCFNRGLVRTPDDFGAQGALPSHPELLDHLAYKFMENGWDMKSILKYILLSSTYQQSSISTKAQIESDPENNLYARGTRSRLSAEKIRDHILASSGLLVPTIGGPSVKPYQPAGLWQEVVGGGGGSSFGYEIDKGEKQYRRSLYTFWKRTVPPPDMMTFDAVTRDFCMVSRETTSTPLQALVMMNSPQVIEGARNLAYRAIEAQDGLENRINFMYKAATSRQPGAEQIAALAAYFEEEKQEFELLPENANTFLAIGDSAQKDLLPAPELAAYAMLATAIYNLDESISRS
ncbi:PSD1 and planctomycete cytochrome C domain-containing protein [Neolewinella persica]|uniref:PSD1 and planctomycete cytochrome C domain-containing protein n=1 Tax=Neolewinella persica TaxID=70998 RepID=UPI000379FD11|nr:PSD1 and planctomycete cytochrome C domain-containing protein [Neolewinella persica]